MIKKRIVEAIASAKKLSQSPKPNPLMPGILGCLEEMLSNLHGDPARKDKLVGGVGRLVMEDSSICNSAFGQGVLKLASDYLKVK